MLDDSDKRKIVMKALEVLSFMTKEQEFKEFFTAEGVNLYLQIIIPFLKITETERETLVSDPQEFCNLIEDACGDQKSTTVKVLTAKLLSNLSENITGFYS